MGFSAFQIVLLLFVILLCSPLSETITSEDGIAASNDFAFPIVFKIKQKPHFVFYAELELQGGETFLFHIDSGSEVTWVQCDVPDAPNRHILDGAPNKPYVPPDRNFIRKNDPLCSGTFARGSETLNRCDYSIEYGDGDSTAGWLVMDDFVLTNTDGETRNTPIVFGCGVNQQSSRKEPPFTDGLIGVGAAALGFQSQLKSHGLSENVFSHCLTVTRPEGFGLFGHDSRATEDQGVWLNMKQRSNAYTAGPVDIYLDEGSYDLGEIEFDSGSSFTRFTEDLYKDTLGMITRSLAGKNMDKSDDTEVTCWYSSQNISYQTIDEVRDKFKDIKLDFYGDNQKIILQPKDYLYIGDDEHKGHVCLGILPTLSSMGDVNLIGAISMLDKLVVYDSKNSHIGWHESINCSFSTGADHRKSIRISGLANVTDTPSTLSSV